MKIKTQELSTIRDQVQLAVTVALQEALKKPLHVKFLSNTVGHDLLQPSGDVFNIAVRVEVHPKEVKVGSASTEDGDTASK